MTRNRLRSHPVQSEASDRVSAPASPIHSDMRAPIGLGGSVLCVANYESDVGYAWWLMENFWAQLARLARERGGRAFVAFPAVRGISPAIREADLIAVELSVPTSLGRGLLRVRRFIRENDVRTVYLTDRPYWSPVYALFRRWGVRSIILHDHMPGERTAPSPLKLRAKRMRHTLLRSGSADLYIGVSQFVADRFSAIAGIPAERCRTVLNGVPSPAEPRSVHAMFGFPADAKIVVSTGRAVSYKGVDFVIRCADHVVRGAGRSDIYFLHLGDGPEIDRFREMAKGFGLDNHFVLAGRRSDVTSLLSSCSMAVHASHGEAFSLAILEFMAAGLPAVVPDHCGNGEAIEHGESGLLYTPGNLEQATEWILRLADDRRLREQIGARAAERAKSEFSLPVMNEHFRSVVGPHIAT